MRVKLVKKENEIKKDNTVSSRRGRGEIKCRNVKQIKGKVLV